jgi:hypothetical protein
MGLKGEVMEINLRKANAIQAEIKRAINSVEMKDTISVSEFCSDVTAEMVTGQDEYKVGLIKKEALTNALYNLRISVGNANAVAGVGSMLGQIELIDAKIKLFEGVANTKVRMLTLEEMGKRLDKIRNTPAEQTAVRYGIDRDSVGTGVVSKDTINDAKARIKQLRKEKQTLQDKLLSINVNTLVSVSEADAKVLGDEGIL